MKRIGCRRMIATIVAIAVVFSMTFSMSAVSFAEGQSQVSVKIMGKDGQAEEIASYSYDSLPCVEQGLLTYTGHNKKPADVNLISIGIVTKYVKIDSLISAICNEKGLKYDKDTWVVNMSDDTGYGLNYSNAPTSTDKNCNINNKAKLVSSTQWAVADFNASSETPTQLPFGSEYTALEVPSVLAITSYLCSSDDIKNANGGTYPTTNEELNNLLNNIAKGSVAGFIPDSNKALRSFAGMDVDANPDQVTYRNLGNMCVSNISNIVIIPKYYDINTYEGTKATVADENGYTKALYGEKVNLQVEADEGYEVTDIKVFDNEGKIINSGNTFTMPLGDVSVKVETANKSAFMAKAAAQGKTSVKLSWTKVKDAKKYIIYGGKCSKEFKKIATVKDTSYIKKSLDKNTNYRFYVVAVKSNDKQVKSKYMHVITGNTKGKYGNVTSITAKKSVIEITSKSKKYKALASEKIYKGKKHLSSAHGAKYRYISTDKKVATVDKNGVITPVADGACYIYIQVITGEWTKTLVKVRLK